MASQNAFPSAVVAEQQDDGTGKEVILDDSECPLQIFRDWPADRGNAHAVCSAVLYCPLQLPHYYYNSDSPTGSRNSNVVLRSAGVPAEEEAP